MSGVRIAVCVALLAGCSALSLKFPLNSNADWDALGNASQLGGHTVKRALLKETDGIFCQYTNKSLLEGCNSTECEVPAIKNLTSAADVCEAIYMHDFARILPFMTTNFTTPYLFDIKGCPSSGVDTLHVPLLAFRTGNRYRSTVCTGSCNTMCERVSDSFAYRNTNMMKTMVPMCHCKALLKSKLVAKAPNNTVAAE